MLKVVVIGYGEMFSNVIAGVLDSGSKIVGVFRHDRIKKSSFSLWFDDMLNPEQDYTYIKSYRLPELKYKSVNNENFRRKLISLNPDIMIVCSWSEKIEKKTFDIPKIATINVHPSLLPKYRGPNPYIQVIKNREKKSGVTLHLVDENFDTGAILDKREVDILPSDTGKELKTKIALKARGAICELLQKMDEDVVFPIIQKEDEATYYTNEFNSDLDFKDCAENIVAKIKSIYPWGRTYFYHKNAIFYPNPYKLVIIDSELNNPVSTVVDFNPLDKSITVMCKHKKLLKMSGINLYGQYRRFFTKGYLKHFVDVGDILNGEDFD
jgi:methionyl-tRNA formyltransferase